jgi:hypothetical protein
MSRYPRSVAILIYAVLWATFCLNMVYPAIIGKYIFINGKAGEGTIVEKFYKRGGQSALMIHYQDDKGKTRKRSYDIGQTDFSLIQTNQTTPIHFLPMFPTYLTLDKIAFQSNSLLILIFVGLVLPICCLLFVFNYERKKI